MKKLISILVLAAFVAMTIMPATSYASMKDCNASSAKNVDCAQMPCCDKDAHNQDKNPCHDNGMCKCVNGICGNGLTKVFDQNDSVALQRLASSQSRFNSRDEHSDSALLERLNRPPRA